MTVIKFPYGTPEERAAKAAQEPANGASVSNIIEVPTDRQLTDGEWAELHSRAFRDLEGDVCDVDRMGEIANDLIMNCSAREDGFHNLELATFAVWQLAKMLKEFRGNYYKRWRGELVGVT
jgi:hypothetical protein